MDEIAELRGEVEMLRALVQVLWTQTLPNTPDSAKALSFALTNAAAASEAAKAAIGKHKPTVWPRKNTA